MAKTQKNKKTQKVRCNIMEQKWHEVTGHHFNTYFNYYDYLYTSKCGCADFYSIKLSNGEILQGMIKEDKQTHSNKYYIK